VRSYLVSGKLDLSAKTRNMIHFFSVNLNHMLIIPEISRNKGKDSFSGTVYVVVYLNSPGASNAGKDPQDTHEREPGTSPKSVWKLRRNFYVLF